ncbi:MAG: histidine phosphatase family protein [Methylibium sp.]|uniref:histidine phosphatase family protein n=1 Tax=Methylibium sp. TaxID=2067992 RepID=UPI0017C1B589|nr:histidine phosphatase family protein [Methylibium sp.]MBA3598479.1 histidine phosphatase family protein [Methylibium sp.]
MSAFAPRRRLYLMRHGSVDYFSSDGTPVPPDTVALNAEGERQADAAGALFRHCGVRFDRALVSGLPRTVQTAERVLATAGQELSLEHEPALREIRGGRLADIPPDQLEQAFLGAFRAGADVESQRFLGGESIGELLDRALPAFDALCARGDWQSMLLVLHGGVNRALISAALAGQRAFFGRLEQQPACINVLDIASNGETVVRSINLAPTQWLHERERYTTMETLLAQYRGGR